MGALGKSLVTTVGGLLWCLTFNAVAALTTSPSPAVGPLNIAYIYTNEWGSPFVVFVEQVDPVCSGGTGLYLFDSRLAESPLKKYKYASILSAKLSNKPVYIQYFKDTELPPGSWAACVIHSIRID